MLATFELLEVLLRLLEFDLKSTAQCATVINLSPYFPAGHLPLRREKQEHIIQDDSYAQNDFNLRLSNTRSLKSFSSN